MPLQNRVDPFGAIFRTPARGTFLGNRGGALHNEAREIVRPYKSRRWITCLLEFKGRRRAVMTPGRYTELFFLDEAVAFAAGHRPCAECRRQRFNAFKEAWRRGVALDRERPFGADEIDAELHRFRIGSRKEKIKYQSNLDSLPNGCFIEIDGSAYLVWDDVLLLWAPEGYREKIPRPNLSRVTVLTPRPVAACFQQGYIPEIHHSQRLL